VVVAKCSDPHRDGGYWSTARMLLESGLCLALDSDKLKEVGWGWGPGRVLVRAATLVLLPRVEGRLWLLSAFAKQDVVVP
jgi:short subunit dehydrogenase-like uncharacterized protein